jgi:hypothetical protein
MQSSALKLENLSSTKNSSQMRSTANEINRLYSTNTIQFVRRSDIPKGQIVTYCSFVVDIKDHKAEKERTRSNVGGDHIEHPGGESTRTAGLTTAKILIKSAIFTPNAKFLVIDITNFYLNTLLGDSNIWSSIWHRSLRKIFDKYDLN